MPRYTNIFHIDEWPDRLKKTRTRLNYRPFSVVYHLFSTKTGPVRYVGSSNNPISRASSHRTRIGYNYWHEELSATANRPRRWLTVFSDVQESVELVVLQ